MWRSFLKSFLIKPTHNKFATVHYAFPVIVIATIFASIASVITENDSYVIVKTPVSSVSEGQEFYIDVAVSAHLPINAVDITLSYSKETLEVVSIDTGTSVITLWAEQPYAKDGKIFLRGGTFRKGFIGEHTIARIKVRANSAGEAKFFVSGTELIAGDGKGTAVTHAESAEYNQIKVAVSGTDKIFSKDIALSVVTDLDGDGKVDLSDLSTFMSAWFTSAKTFDFNGDGRMTFVDFSILLADSFFK